MSIPDEMAAMVVAATGRPLELRRLPVPRPGPEQVLLEVAACGVCRTDLHLVDGELPEAPLPVIPGHEIVGRVAAVGESVDDLAVGERIGVPWLGWTCGECRFCRIGRENLCDRARFTGYTLPGGYAEYAVADRRYCFRLPDRFGDLAAAPLLCAGLIGYRSLRMCGAGVERLGLYGFGAAAHIVAQVAGHRGAEVYAFTRPGDAAAQGFARSLGAVWAGDSTTPPPEPLDAAIVFAPVGALVPAALRAVRKGGTVVCGGIHMSDIPSFPYRVLWEERALVSVANLERRDGHELFSALAEVPLQIAVEPFALGDANQALAKLREGRLTGAAVLAVAP